MRLWLLMSARSRYLVYSTCQLPSTRWITTSSSTDFAFHSAFVVQLLVGLTHSFAREHKWSITMVRQQRRKISNAALHKELYWVQFYFYCTRLTCLTLCNTTDFLRTPMLTILSFMHTAKPNHVRRQLSKSLSASKILIGGCRQTV